MSRHEEDCNTAAIELIPSPELEELMDAEEEYMEYVSVYYDDIVYDSLEMDCDIDYEWEYIEEAEARLAEEARLRDLFDEAMMDDYLYVIGDLHCELN